MVRQENLTSKVYLQKSRLFLLPLLEVKKDKHIKPVSTYLQDATFNTSDYRLILPFERDESSEFYYYEKELVDSPYFDTDSFYETKKYLVYVYNLSKYEEDYDKVLRGHYTELTSRTKGLISIYYGTVQGEKFYAHPNIDAYLNPTILTYERYSEELNIPVKTLKKVKELLNPPNIEKETFIESRISKTKQPGGDTVESSPL